MTSEIQDSSANYGLARNVLSSLETLAQAVAGIAPSAAPAMTVAIVFGLAGNGAWFTYLIAIGILTLNALCINVYAVRWSTPGSLYAYVTAGGGRYAGFTSGWCLLLAYLLGISACSIQFAVFVNEILRETIGLQAPLLIGSTICAASTCLIARRNIKLSAEVMLWMELLSLFVIAALCVIVQIRLGFHIDHAQLSLEGTSPQGFCTGLVMALFGFVGFESAATLGAEAEDPKKKIPQALLSSVICSGIFFVLATITIVAAFKGMPEIKLASCTTPLLVMSDKFGVPWLGKLTNFGAAISFFACSLAATNAAGRIILTMAHDNFFPAQLATVSTASKTPAKAITAAVLVGYVPGIVLVTLGFPTMDIIGWLGTLATYGYLAAYFLVSITCCSYLKSIGHPSRPMTIVATISAICTLAAFAGTIYPVPEGAYRWLPYVCSAYIVVGLLCCHRRKAAHTAAITGPE